MMLQDAMMRFQLVFCFEHRFCKNMFAGTVMVNIGLTLFDSYDFSHLPVVLCTFEVSQPSSISQEESEGGRMMTKNPTTRILGHF